MESPASINIDGLRADQVQTANFDNLITPSVIDELACKISAKLVLSNQKPVIDEIASKIAAKIVLANCAQKEKEKNNSGEFWIASDKFWICEPCLFHSNSKSVPAKLKKGRRGNFGYVGKTGKKSKINANKNTHLQKPLHKWCVRKYQKEIENKTAFDRRNELAGKKIIRNALFCFMHSLRSTAFVAINMKDFLSEKDFGSDQYNYATKNDSKSEIFRLRNVVFEVFTDKMQKFFAKNVNDIAVTLDKVTVQRTGYLIAK